jgi:hypothetical protein
MAREGDGVGAIALFASMAEDTVSHRWLRLNYCPGYL